MRKLLSTCLLLAAAFTSQAQLVSSLDFSTGYDNTTGTAMPLGVQDPSWRIIALSAPFPPAGPIPYDAFTQNPWGPGPTIPANTRWISYDGIGMTTAAPPDFSGGSTTYEYHFETCREDKITFSATMRSDNRISAVRVDGVTTPYSQPTFTTLNWTSGSAFGYSVTLPAGYHTLEVDVLNAPSGNATNPTGLNVSGNITSTGNSIIDRDNFPDYVCCNANFHYCIGSANPYVLDLSADDPSQPGSFDWYVNGSYIGSGTNFSYLLAPGSYEICLHHKGESSECRKCLRVCIPDNGAVPHPAKKAGPNSQLGNATQQTFEIGKVYPNPATSQVNIELNSSEGSAISVKMYDVMGKVVREENVTATQGQTSITMSTERLSTGIYTLHISDGQSVIVKKIEVKK